LEQAYLLDIEQLDYADAYILQQKLQKLRSDNSIPDTLILLEHPPVITTGRSGGREHLKVLPEKLLRQGIPIYETDRGGSVTFHGLGQVVAYPIFNLRISDGDLLLFLRMLEEVVIKLLKIYGLKGERFPPYTGVWVNGKKIAAIGVSCRNSVTMHGLALNVNTDLSYFSLINPCGISGYDVTSMAECLGGNVSIEMLRNRLSFLFAIVFKLFFTRLPDQFAAGYIPVRAIHTGEKKAL